MRYVIIPTDKLALGMYVSKLDRPWEETSFLFQGFKLDNSEDIAALRKYCKHVTVDNDQSDFITRQPTKNKIKRSISIDQEMPRAQAAFFATKKLIKKVMADARIGRSVDLPESREAVNDMVASIERNSNAMTLLTRLRQKDSYTAEHSLSVSVLSTALGCKLGMETDALRTLGLAGMLHDIGKVLSPDEVLLKASKLTDEEMVVMKKHPVDGREILCSSNTVQDHVLSVALGHHEKLDGSGYPNGVLESSISHLTKIVSVVDTYDAITSDRVYDKGRSNMAAFDILMAGRGLSWDSNLVIKFIETIGVYPPGTIVKLSTGKIAVVIEHNVRLKLRPTVLVIQDPSNMMEGMQLIDLAKELKDEKGNALKIVKVMSHSNNSAFLENLKDQGLLAAIPANPFSN